MKFCFARHHLGDDISFKRVKLLRYACPHLSITTSPQLLVRSLYDVLQVHPKATQRQIKHAYYDLSMKLHPDQNQNDPAAAVKFNEIVQAYDTLSDPYKRRLYDQKTRSGPLRPHQNPQPYQGPRPKPFTRNAYKEQYKDFKYYNFEEWYRNHYPDQVRRQRRSRATFHERNWGGTLRQDQFKWGPRPRPPNETQSPLHDNRTTREPHPGLRFFLFVLFIALILRHY